MRWVLVVLLVLGCSKTQPYSSNFASVKIVSGRFVDAKSDKPYAGTLVARDQEIRAVANGLLGDTLPQAEDFDLTGLLIVVPIKDGVPEGKARVLVDMRAPKLNAEVARRNDALTAIARTLSPQIAIAEATFVAGKLDGVATVFEPDASGKRLKVAEVPFRDGALNGTVRELYAGTDQVHREVTYAGSQKTGAQRAYHPNGKLAREATYAADRLHGEVKEYYADGKPSARRMFDHGTPIGTHEAWYPNGQRERTITFESGEVVRDERWYSNGQPTSEPANGVIETYYASGQVHERTTYVNGVKHGTYATFYATGKPAVQATYAHGALDGEYRALYANGKDWERATYAAGKTVGAYRKWWKNGKPAHVYSYDENGKLDGEYKQLYDTGAKWVLATYVHGKPQGAVKRWYPDGTLGYEMNHTNGRPDGPYRRWWSNGKPRLEATYKNGVLDGDFKNWLADGQVYELAVYERGTKVKSTREAL